MTTFTMDDLILSLKVVEYVLRNIKIHDLSQGMLWRLNNNNTKKNQSRNPGVSIKTGRGKGTEKFKKSKKYCKMFRLLQFITIWLNKQSIYAMLE